MRELIKVENKSEEEIEEIGRKIGEAFAAEKAGIVTALTREQAVKAFEIMTECYYRAGVLYTTSKKGEGYLAYWHKSERPAMGPVPHMIKRFLCELPPKAWIAMIGSGGNQYAKVFQKEKDYIAAESKKIYPLRHGTVRREKNRAWHFAVYNGIPRHRERQPL